MVAILRELVLVDEDVVPRTLLVGGAPEIRYAWRHRLLDPIKLETLLRLAGSGAPAGLDVAAESDDVIVIVVPLVARRAITKLPADHPALRNWLE